MVEVLLVDFFVFLRIRVEGAGGHFFDGEPLQSC